MGESLEQRAEKVRKNIDKNIFRGYDIRGDATITDQSPKINLKEEDAYLIGQAIASMYVKKGQYPKVLITGDHRPSTPILKDSIAEGFKSLGSEVYIVKEPIPTGVTSWYILEYSNKFDISIQITGSHNPYYNNGFKITAKQINNVPDINGTPQALYGENIQKVYNIIINNDIPKTDKKGKIEIYDKDILKEYYQSITKYFNNLLKNNGKYKKNFKVVLDAGNGLGAKAIPILQDLGVEIYELFTQLDGKFPNHPADPSIPEGIKYAQEKVKELNKEKLEWIGLVFDGDGDRTGVIDEEGTEIYPEKILILFYTRFLLSNIEGFKILSKLNEKVGLALDVRGSKVIGCILEYLGQALAIREYCLQQSKNKDKIEEYFNTLLSKLWKYPSIDIDNLPENIKIENKKWEEIVKNKQNFGIIGEYIKAGYPNFRNYIAKQIEKLEKIIPTLENQEQKDILQKMILEYTSAESSGHFFFSTCKKYPKAMVDDGIFSAVYLLYLLDTLEDFEVKYNIIPKDKSSICAQILTNIKWTPISHEIRDNAEDSIKFQIVEDIKKIVQEEIKVPSTKFRKKIKNLIDVDGVRVEFEDNSFLLVRASNTSPKLNFKFGALTQERLIEVIEETLNLLKNYKDISLKNLKKELEYQKGLKK